MDNQKICISYTAEDLRKAREILRICDAFTKLGGRAVFSYGDWNLRLEEKGFVQVFRDQETVDRESGFLIPSKKLLIIEV